MSSISSQGSSSARKIELAVNQEPNNQSGACQYTARMTGHDLLLKEMGKRIASKEAFFILLTTPPLQLTHTA